jgi:hypothetical protein
VLFMFHAELPRAIKALARVTLALQAKLEFAKRIVSCRSENS